MKAEERLISVKERYGLLRPGLNYRVFKQGLDYVAVKHNGGLTYVPNFLATHPVVEETKEDELNLNPLFNF